MLHEVFMRATKYIRVQVEAPTKEEAELHALQMVKTQFKLVKIVDITDIESAEAI